MRKNDGVPSLDRRLFLVTASSLALAACGSLDKVLGPPDAPQIYALRPAVPTARPGGSKVSWALAILKPDASSNLDTARIALARSDTRLDYYANAAWPDRLPDLVQTALLAGFEATGRIDAVSRSEDALHSDYELSTDLRDFEARYDAPDGAPSVAVTIIAHVADARSRKIVANLPVSFTQPATANSVDSVVEAFAAALAKAVDQIVQWTLALPAPGDGAEPEAPQRPSRPARTPEIPPPRAP
jgi:cholesterol transport system auxiliary component